MSQDWMIDVLVDLQGFAQQNGLPRLVAHLDQSIQIAAEEIVSNSLKEGAQNKDATAAGSTDRTHRAC